MGWGSTLGGHRGGGHEGTWGGMGGHEVCRYHHQHHHHHYHHHYHHHQTHVLYDRHHKVSPSPCPHLNTNNSVKHEVKKMKNNSV